MKSFDECLSVEGYADATAIASDLFRESFGVSFPTPCDLVLAGEQVRREDWRQYVAFYTAGDGAREAVGFCNWIRCGDVYLGGGMCVKRGFYKRLPPAHFRECRARGGVAQIALFHAAAELTDGLAQFGYCGDRKAFLVDTRAGFAPTSHPHLIVKWFAEVPEAAKREIENRIAAIGPF